MGFPIPKIEYLNVTQLGNTHSSTSVTGLLDTSTIEPGMSIVGSGVPTGATVSSIDSLTAITISSATTTTLSQTSLDFAHKIAFDYPPVEKSDAKLDPKERIATSISGIRQVSIDFIEKIRAFDFKFLSQSIYEALVTFMEDHALYGREFRYYDDKNDSAYDVVELSSLKWQASKMMGKGEDSYVWEAKIETREVL